MRLLLKAIQDSFKYLISLIELFHREQLTEKGFVFNVISFVFDAIVLILNIVSFLIHLTLIETVCLHTVQTIVPSLSVRRDY